MAQYVFRKPPDNPQRLPTVPLATPGDQPPGNVRAGSGGSWPSPYWILMRQSTGAFLFGNVPGIPPYLGTSKMQYAVQYANAWQVTWSAQRMPVVVTESGAPSPPVGGGGGAWETIIFRRRRRAR